MTDHCNVCDQDIDLDAVAVPGEDRHRLNGAGRVMHIPWTAELGFYEPAPGDPLWWLSFCDPDRPEGSQFLGVAIVQAPVFDAAVTRSHAIGVNPGGQVATCGPIDPEVISPEWRNRLLTRDEAESIPGPVA